MNIALKQAAVNPSLHFLLVRKDYMVTDSIQFFFFFFSFLFFLFFSFLWILLDKKIVKYIFGAGCMYHSERGLASFEHPMKKMKAMPRVDSEGVMCGANFKVDVYSKVKSMPRVGSEANWAI